MKHLQFQSCKADPDVWLCESQSIDGEMYWEYILLYVDNVLCILNNADNSLKKRAWKIFCDQTRVHWNHKIVSWEQRFQGDP